MQRFPELSMQRNSLPTFCPGLHRRQQIVRTRTVLTDQRPVATGIQIAQDRDNWRPTISLQRASAIATMTETEIRRPGNKSVKRRNQTMHESSGGWSLVHKQSIAGTS
jgi:hypothetical protein